MGPADASSQTGVEDNQTVGRHRLPRGRPQDRLQRDGPAGPDQPRVSPQRITMRRLWITVRYKEPQIISVLTIKTIYCPLYTITIYCTVSIFKSFFCAVWPEFCRQKQQEKKKKSIKQTKEGKSASQHTQKSWPSKPKVFPSGVAIGVWKCNPHSQLELWSTYTLITETVPYYTHIHPC